MSLLYPEFLWALLLNIFPVIIHLFNLQRHETLYFSDLTLLKNIEKETKRTSQIKNIILMILRMLMISSLVIAFCLPQNDNASLATSFVNAQRIAMYLNYTTNPPKITESTSGIKLNIGTTMGISLDSAQVVVGEVVRTWMAKVGVDPFTVVVQVQNRDPRGVRGRWR